MDYRIIGRNNGDSMFCIVLKETENEIVVMFPMTIEKHVMPIGPTSIRETYSASQLCPFTEERVFVFYKPELLYIKPLSKEAIPFYVGMINRHESLETMKKYNIEGLIEEDRILPNTEETMKRLEAISQFLSESGEEEEEEETTVVRGNKTVH
jgi:hypothetical protein